MNTEQSFAELVESALCDDASVGPRALIRMLAHIYETRIQILEDEVLALTRPEPVFDVKECYVQAEGDPIRWNPLIKPLVEGAEDRPSGDSPLASSPAPSPEPAAVMDEIQKDVRERMAEPSSPIVGAAANQEGSAGDEEAEEMELPEWKRFLFNTLDTDAAKREYPKVSRQQMAVTFAYLKKRAARVSAQSIVSACANGSAAYLDPVPKGTDADLWQPFLSAWRDYLREATPLQERSAKERLLRQAVEVLGAKAPQGWKP